MKKSVLLSILFLASYGGIAQADYVLTLKSDTLRGDVRILSYDQIDRVQVSVNGKKQLLSALDVRLVSLNNEYYKAVQQEKSVRLMKIIKSGYLSLYGFKLPNMTTYDGRYLVRLDGANMELPNLGFKKTMSSLLEDCAEISDKVKNGVLGKNKIEEIVESYNICVSKPKETSPVETVAADPDKTARLQAIQNLSAKINELNFDGKGDALDILHDMQSKVEKGENVSKYQMDGLQTILKDQPAITEAWSTLVNLFKK
jgi:hypothetical protein